jgi:hypothetical protein
MTRAANSKTTHAARSPPARAGVSRKRFIARLRKEPTELKKKILFVGFLSKELSKQGVTVFLVGGQAVEIYTAGQFTTGDVDITVTDRKAAERLLTQLGFSKEGMIWLNENLGIAVHIVATYPTRTLRARVIEVDGYEVKTVAVEDLIIDRLASAKFWRSNPKLDVEEAKVLYTAFFDGLAIDYLKGRAKDEKVDDFLEEITTTP